MTHTIKVWQDRRGGWNWEVEVNYTDGKSGMVGTTGGVGKTECDARDRAKAAVSKMARAWEASAPEASP